MYLDQLEEYDDVIILDGTEWHGRKGVVMRTYHVLGFVDVFCMQGNYRVYESNSKYIFRAS